MNLLNIHFTNLNRGVEEAVFFPCWIQKSFVCVRHGQLSANSPEAIEGTQLRRGKQHHGDKQLCDSDV